MMKEEHDKINQEGGFMSLSPLWRHVVSVPTPYDGTLTVLGGSEKYPAQIHCTKVPFVFWLLLGPHFFIILKYISYRHTQFET